LAASNLILIVPVTPLLKNLLLLLCLSVLVFYSLLFNTLPLCLLALNIPLLYFGGTLEASLSLSLLCRSPWLNNLILLHSLNRLLGNTMFTPWPGLNCLFRLFGCLAFICPFRTSFVTLFASALCRYVTYEEQTKHSHR
jgi:hypothetical protein